MYIINMCIYIYIDTCDNSSLHPQWKSTGRCRVSWLLVLVDFDAVRRGAGEMGTRRTRNSGTIETISGWWFGTYIISPYIGNNHPNRC